MPEVSTSTTVWSSPKGIRFLNAYAPAPFGLEGTAFGARPSLVTEGVSEPASPRGHEERYSTQGELPGGYYLANALQVRVWIEGAEFVAEQPQLRVHAFGQDQIAAILNLREQLVRQLERLNAAGDKVGPRLTRDRDWLRKLISRSA